MASVEQKFTVSDDRHTVAWAIEVDGVQIASMAMEAADVDDHIHKLAALREQLADRIADQVEPNSRAAAIIDPSWWVPAQHSHSAHGPALFLRHPAFGWLSFLFGSERATSIAQALLERADQRQE